MNEIMRQVAGARRRLTTLLFTQAVLQAWLVTFSAATVLLFIPKLWPLPIDAERWAIVCVSAAAGLGLLWAIGATWLRRPTAMVAAIEIDRRLQLRERLSSTLQLSKQDRQSAIGQALESDAQRAANRVDIRDAFPLSLNKAYAWGLLPILLSAATFLLPNAELPPEIAKGLSSTTLTQIKSSTQDLMELVQKQREKAEEEGLDEAVEFFKQLQNKVADLQKSNVKDTKKILSDINQLKEAMRKRREELGSADSMKKNLANLKSLDKGPAEKMTEAMKDGDFDNASQELEKMIQDLETGKLSADQQSQLAKQMEQLAAALEQAATEHEQAKEELKKQIANAEKSGDIQKVAELREKLAEKEMQDASIKELAELASEMKEAKDALEKGDQAAAQKAMEKMKSRVEQMDANAKQLKELDKLIDGANECKKCANGQMEGGAGKGEEDRRWKKGLGEGAGAGERPEEETETRHIESQVRTDMLAGDTLYGGKAGGANRKGVTREEIQQSVLAADLEDANALEDISVPKKQREHTREYFESLRTK